ncbi:dTDP-4-keto-6-deoxy-D-glucose epimerase [Pseudohoeflea suaedae]|uniref:dTDP-4-dehydrorhamnose 3,5-epimerase n=1 Tax=Pseudohoeflea suaedae TaxID=877384 RepID=A0A4V3A7C0_9HYPH|nr:dTDP-4-dehydrorhamnose 3,5-epimerase family protein [Pseudohoeflea suaedae]TDH38155.1 dTDP-4-keto-6-deoxy-D-glucose epimerase [Pseudohoeflea suaedae]
MSLDIVQLADGGADGPALVRRAPFRDGRGQFSRLFAREELAAEGLGFEIVHVNHSATIGKGTIRGFHYQKPPHGEIKLVSCIRGAVLDVAVDIRPGSPRRFRALSAELSAGNATAMLIPDGFAHGFQALTEEVELIYLHSAAYVADAADGYRFDDPAIGFDWPLQPANLSERDRNWPLTGERAR